MRAMMLRLSNDSQRMVVQPDGKWALLSAFLWSPRYDQMRLIVSAPGRTTFEVCVRDIEDHHYVKAMSVVEDARLTHFNVGLLADVMPAEEVYLEIFARTYADPVVVYTIELRPEPSAVDQLGALAGE